MSGISIRKEIFRRIAESKLLHTFLSNPTPSWMVLAVDLLIVALSCLITYSFNPVTRGAYVGFMQWPFTHAAIIFIVYALMSQVVKAHRFIVRLSVVEDMYRIVLYTISASAILTAAALITKWISGTPYFSIWNVFIIGVFSFTLMMITRLVIKYIYRVLAAPEESRKRVIMLGSAVNSFFFASALKSEVDGRFNPVALLSLTDKTINNTVSGIPIIKYDKDTIADVFAKYNCNTLLFLSTQLELMRQEAADEFLKHNIHLLMLNQVEEFDAGNASGANLSTHVRDIAIEDLLGREPIRSDKTDVRNAIHNQVVMITGAAGSIGSEIVSQVAALGAGEIVLLDQAETPMHDMQLRMEAEYPHIKIHLFVGDVVNRERMEQAFRLYHPRYVYHAAAYKHVPMMERNPSEAVLTNVFGTKNLADLAVKYGVEKFVMISTDKAVNPTNVMGASKRIAEIYVQSLFFHLRAHSDRPSTRFITTRFGNVLGSNGSVIPLFRKQIEKGGPVTVTHRDIIRYFMTIPEACSLVLQAGCMGSGGEIFIFDMGQPIKIYDLATRMISLSGLTPGKDIQIIETGLRPGEKLYEELLNDRERTIATHHNKIMIAKVRTYDYANVLTHINRLHDVTHTCNYHDIVAEMKHIVPEYISQNSQWAKIDKEISHEASDANEVLLETTSSR